MAITDTQATGVTTHTGITDDRVTFTADLPAGFDLDEDGAAALEADLEQALLRHLTTKA